MMAAVSAARRIGLEMIARIEILDSAEAVVRDPVLAPWLVAIRGRMGPRR